MCMPTARVCSLFSVGDVSIGAHHENIIHDNMSCCLACAGAANANEVFSDNSVTSPFGAASLSVAQDFLNCVNADTQIASSKAIRACTKAYQASAPQYALRSEILTRRGLLQLSNGDFKKASRDFKKASELSEDNNLANLGSGFAALLQNDTSTALARFKDCDDHGDVAPLAAYGLALAFEQIGKTDSAAEAYQRALGLKPDWPAAKENLLKLRAAT